MKLSIIILTYQRYTDCLNLLDQINNSPNGYDLQVVLIDNNYEYDECISTHAISKSSSIDYKYFHDGENRGVARGRNKGVELSDSDLLLFLDDDVIIVDLDFMLRSIFDEMKNKKNGALAGNIIDFKTQKHNRFEIPHANKEIDMSEDFYTYLAIGACHVIRKDVFIEVGGLSTDFGLYGMEEIEMSLKIINVGREIKYKSSMQVFHLCSPSGRLPDKNKLYNLFVNRTLIAKSHLKTRYYLSNFLVWGGVFLFKTQDFSLFFKASMHILNSTRNVEKFTPYFYGKIKKMKGRLWY